MNTFDTIILDLILIIFPLMIYLIYTAYSKTLDLKKHDLYLDCALFSAYYLFIRLGVHNLNDIPILLIDVILVISYLKNKKFSLIILSMLLGLYYYDLFQISIFIFILEYLFYFFLYKVVKVDNKLLFTNIFIGIKVIMFIVEISLSSKYDIVLNYDILIIYIVLFFIFTNFVIYLYDEIDNMFSLHRQIKKIDKEKQITESLFKITHEIKNPIAVCKGYLDMFDTDNIEHSKRYVPILKSEISRVLSLLEDFLSITKIKIEKEEMDLNMLLEDTISCLKPILTSKNITFISNIDDEEVYIYADYNRLKQTLINIIKNSKESIGKKGTIKLFTKIDKHNIKIIIEDDGVGMTKDELSKIKEAFFTTKEKGTGLGTYLSNEIIRLHGGSLDYYSKKNVGTKVVVTLPC